MIIIMIIWLSRRAPPNRHCHYYCHNHDGYQYDDHFDHKVIGVNGFYNFRKRNMTVIDIYDEGFFYDLMRKHFMETQFVQNLNTSYANLSVWYLLIRLDMKGSRWAARQSISTGYVSSCMSRTDPTSSSSSSSSSPYFSSSLSLSL